jgi:glucose-6-phosphate 1-dehydrogenase
MSPPTYVEAIIFIMVGLAGDLSRRKLVPALDNLFVENRLPGHFAILGVGHLHRRAEDFRGAAPRSGWLISRYFFIVNGQWAGGSSWKYFTTR